MNNDLKRAIHNYAYDREIDYTSAQYIGEQFGMKFGSQSELISWKQAIDVYLKTFSEENLQKVENMIK